MYAKNLDPELEKLRKEALRHQALETVILDAVASKIHAAYLFENEGRQLLQKLCLFVSATASGKIYGDWQMFAAHLGLLNEQIRCIDYDFKGLQDPTYYTLLAFIQNDDATIDKIYLALQKLERLDVINRLASYFNEFVKDITKNQEMKNGMYQPNSIPKAPLVLSPIVKKDTYSNQETVRITSNDSKNNIANSKVRNIKYGSIIMLTFAEDGKSTVEKIAKVFRSADPKIGVIILQEQEKHIFSGAEKFVEECFQQVNYIVPILTQGYLNKINNYTPYESDNNNMDAKYIRYIFSLLRYEYVKADCINNRVRCIIPDAQLKKVLSMEMHPTLHAWFRESDVPLFTDRILLQKL
ncbi:uncharacterized protein LOC106637283 [Copidosoma floridanum]|uniref:uncharacterized protein LOC106637283 n=1 Tax=Copidosoma floridanum TaxID=29053 RepID=UPI0006C9870D|nr:uncharacterized protein LOC106637283 [Copidosoma floridanum]